MEIKKIAGWVRKIEVGALVVLGVAATLIMFGNAAGRYIFQSTFVWAEECIRILFVWAMFIAITDAFFSNEHIGFGNVVDKLPLTKHISALAYNAVLAIIGIILGVFGAQYNALTGDVPLPGTSLPNAVLMLPGVCAGFVWFALGTVRFLLLVKKLLTKKGQ